MLMVTIARVSLLSLSTTTNSSACYPFRHLRFLQSSFLSASSSYSYSCCFANPNPSSPLHTLRTPTAPPPPLLVFMSIAPDGPPPGYRPNVGVCLVNSNNQVFVASRVDLPDSWQMPQGGVEEDEEPRAAAIRELKEETGVSSVEIIGEVPEWMTYDFPPDVKVRITQMWGKEWNGQAQKWFLLRFMGDESEINLDGDGLERPEFSDWKWASPDEVIGKAVNFKRPVYEKVFKAFNPLLTSKDDANGILTHADEM